MPDGRVAAWWRQASPARRLGCMLVPMAPCLLGIVAFHAFDASKRGESGWPVLLGVGLVALIVGAVVWFVRRPVEGLEAPEAMRMRSRQVVKWAAPLAVAFAILGAIAQALLARH